MADRTAKTRALAALLGNVQLRLYLSPQACPAPNHGCDSGLTALGSSSAFGLSSSEFQTMGLAAPERMFHPDDRVAVFIDGANLYQAAKALGFDIDYKRLLQTLAADCRFVRAYYYPALLDEQEYSPIRPLVDWLDYNGYTMVTKPLKEFTQSTGRRKFKGNMDVEITVDVMEMAKHLDHVVLLSGDGDFRRLVEAVQRRGVRVTVVSTIRTQPPMIADELRRQADQFIDLSDLQPYIAREHVQRPEAATAPSSQGQGPGSVDNGFDDDDGEPYED